ncbi:MAG: DNA circularization protein [Sphingorhabdus sp.]
MAWEDRYQQGSFRGVSFKTQRHDKDGGRRLAPFEYPQRDRPYVEDLGRRIELYRVDCLVIGADYMEERDALERALKQAGSGVLVHPYLGQLDVSVDRYTLTESTEEGGLARFTIDFLESGRSLAGETNVDSQALAIAKADSVSAEAPATFNGSYRVAGLPSYVEQGALANLKLFGVSAQESARLLGGAGKALVAYEAGIALLDSGLTLIRTPITLAETVRGIVRSVAGLTTLPLMKIAALRSLFQSGNAFRAVIGGTPARKVERTNRQAMANLVEATSGAEIVRAVVTARFSSYQEAQSLRDALADLFDQSATAAADRGDDSHAATLDSLRRAMARDITARGATLARLFSYTPRATEPALVIANRIYGTTDIEARTAEIVSRNKVRHPGFVPGGIALELLTRVDAMEAAYAG